MRVSNLTANVEKRNLPNKRARRRNRRKHDQLQKRKLPDIRSIDFYSVADSYGKMVSIQNTLMSAPFKRNGFVSAAAGSLVFGTVHLHQGVLCYSEPYTVDYYKIPEFLELLKTLGKNLVAEDDEDMLFKQMEVNEGESLIVRDRRISRYIADEEDYSILMDQFMYIRFLLAFAEVSVFMVNPTPMQFEAIEKYINIGKTEKTNEERIAYACKKETISESERFLLYHFIKKNCILFDFVSSVKQLTKTNETEK